MTPLDQLVETHKELGQKTGLAKIAAADKFADAAVDAILFINQKLDELEKERQKHGR